MSLAKRMQISQAALSKLERHEAEGTIPLAKLEQIADALGCDLVYIFSPRSPLGTTARAHQQIQNRARRLHRRIPRIE